MAAGVAVWITGLPASGKSSITAELIKGLSKRGVTPEVLESDRLREILTPEATYAPAERDLFYRAMAYTGSRLAACGALVIFDATANRRAYRELARSLVERFVEVWVDTPLAVCEARDRKGTYRKGIEGRSANVPGLQAAYEPPLNPDLVIRGETESPAEAAERIVGFLVLRGHLNP